MGRQAIPVGPPRVKAVIEQQDRIRSASRTGRGTHLALSTARVERAHRLQIGPGKSAEAAPNRPVKSRERSGVTGLFRLLSPACANKLKRVRISSSECVPKR